MNKMVMMLFEGTIIWKFGNVQICALHHYVED